MSEGERPSLYLVLKHKETGEKLYIADGWNGEHGPRFAWAHSYEKKDGTMARGVAALILTDGKRINLADYWFNGGSRKSSAPAPRKSQRESRDDDMAEQYGDEDIPF